MKIVLMSHFGFAEGMKQCLTYFNQSAESMITINAYLNDLDPKKELEKVLSSLDGDEKVLIFTDIMGGSVNQIAVHYLNNPNIYVFAGMNLGMILQATCLSNQSTHTEICDLERVGKASVVCMNTYTFESFSQDDE